MGGPATPLDVGGCTRTGEGEEAVERKLLLLAEELLLGRWPLTAVGWPTERTTKKLVLHAVWSLLIAALA